MVKTRARWVVLFPIACSAVSAGNLAVDPESLVKPDLTDGERYDNQTPRDGAGDAVPAGAGAKRLPPAAAAPETTETKGVPPASPRCSDSGLQVPPCEKARHFQKLADKATNSWGLIGEHSDTAIWSGVYAAAMAYRYAATKDPEALERMEKTLKGLHALKAITGEGGMIARSIEPHPDPAAPLPAETHLGAGPYAGYRWKGKLTWDPYLGYLYGISEAYPLIQDPELKASIREDLRRIAYHFMSEDGKASGTITGPDTELDAWPHYWGRWSRTWPGSWIRYLLPIKRGNSAHGLHLMQVAANVTEDPKIVDYYRRVMIAEDEYHEIADDFTTDRSMKRWGWLVTIATNVFYTLKETVLGIKDVLVGEPRFDYGFLGMKATVDSTRSDVAANLGHIRGYDMAAHEKDPAVRENYLNFLKEIHEGVDEQKNTYWNFLYASQFPDERQVRHGLESLQGFPMDDYGRRKNSDDPSMEDSRYKGLSGDFFKSKAAWSWHTPYPGAFPIQCRPMHSFAWQQNATKLDGEYGSGDAPGVAYLVAYWMGAKQGYLPAGCP